MNRSDSSTVSDWFRIGAAAAVISAMIAASQTGAHEEDWLKLADMLPPVESAPIVGKPLAGEAIQEFAGFEASNMTLLSQLPLNSFEGGPSSGNDCWGYVSPSGREYAIFGSFVGTHFVEVTDPVNPVQIETIFGFESFWRDIKVYGEYAYSVNETGGGVQVIDMSQIDDGVVTLVRNVTSNGLQTIHNVEINPDSPFLYLSGSNLGNGSLRVMSLADPANPTLVGGWVEGGADYTHDVQVVSYTEGPMAGREIAYCFSGFGALDVLDVTNKGNIFRIGGSAYPDLRYCHQGWLSEDRQYLYLNDELDEREDPDVTTTLTRVFDVSNPANPTLVSTFTTGLPSVDHNLYVKDDLIYQANYRSGLRVFEYSDPENPTEVAYFDTFPNSNSASFTGAWSNYPFLPSGNIIISDINRGLFMVRLDLTFLGFSYPDGLVDRIEPGEASEVVVEIDDSRSPVVPGTVTLHASVNGLPFTQTTMSDNGDGTFGGALPAGECFDEIRYYVSAENEAGDTYTSPSGAPGDAFVATVATSEVVPVDDNLELPTGWTVGAPGDDATTGVWNRMDPEGTDAQPEDDRTPDGTVCFVTDGRAGGSLGAFDVDGGRTTLVSPVFDLTDLDGAMVSYWRWYSNDTGGAPNADVFTVQISDDGGANWTNLEVVGPGGEGTGGGWTFAEYLVSDFVSLTDSVRLRFIAADEGEPSLVEAAVDDLRIGALECDDVACPVDWNGDGAVNAADVGAFLSSYFTDLANGTTVADYDGNGITNAADVGAFLSDFFTADQICP